MAAVAGEPRSSGTQPARALRLAIAEDSLLVREGLARVLRAAGFDVVGETATVEQLLALVERERPDAVLIDIRLPPTHSDEGLRAAAEIRRRSPSIALLVLSQYVEPEYALRLLEGDERASATSSRTGSSTSIS